jgi:DMSO/TMAO reductase YedYZ molybdopterin-dependent catalytic subunit
MSKLSELGIPVFSAGGRPDIDINQYSLHIGTMAEHSGQYTMEQIKSWPQSRVDARLTSVSGWSVRAMWEGVIWRDFINIVRPDASAGYATFVSLGGGYETTISLDDLDHDRVLLCHSVEGELLEIDYGGPLRMIIPHLYGYKSAKWLGRIDFETKMKGGYWEDRGYSRNGQIEPGNTLDMNTGQRRPIQGGEVLDF